MENTSIFENLLDEVKYLETYRKNFNCSSCGSVLSSFVCKKCNKEIVDNEIKEKLNGIIINLTNIINSLPKEVYFNDTLNYLYMMKDIEVVGNYIEETGYKEILKKEKQRLSTLLGKGEGLTNVDSKKFEFIYSHCTNREDKEKCSVFVFKERLLMNSEFSMEFFEKAIIDFINFICIDAGLPKDSFKVFVKELEGRHGEVNYKNELSIDRERIRKLYSNGNVLSIITIFHEARHLMQRHLYDLYNKPNLYVFTMLKERIMSFYSDYHKEEYYKKNYDKLSTELDAQRYAIIDSRKYFDRLQVVMNDDYEQRFSKELDRVSSLQKDFIREIDGLEDTVDNLFDFFVTDKPELLEKWPYLKYQYICSDGKTVRSKTREELIEQWENFDYSGMTEEESRNAKLFLLQLINNKKEETLSQIDDNIKK